MKTIEASAVSRRTSTLAAAVKLVSWCGPGFLSELRALDTGRTARTGADAWCCAADLRSGIRYVAAFFKTTRASCPTAVFKRASCPGIGVCRR